MKKKPVSELLAVLGQATNLAVPSSMLPLCPPSTTIETHVSTFTPQTSKSKNDSRTSGCA